ncbi:MAG: primase-helicase zinc-binding domain-containing protein [Synechococcaceae cyanobacterium]
MAGDALAAADGQWPRLLIELAGLAPEQLQNRHQPCPACGGTDRYRWDQDEGAGGWFCNQCGGKDHRGGGGNGMDLLLVGSRRASSIWSRALWALSAALTRTESSSATFRWSR